MTDQTKPNDGIWTRSFSNQETLMLNFWSDVIIVLIEMINKAIFTPMGNLLGKLGGLMKPTNSNKLDQIIKQLQLLQERVDAMAISLDALSSEVDRASTIQSDAIGLIGRLLSDVRVVTDELTIKAAAAENSVDAEQFNQLLSKLRTSTDALEAAVTAKQPQP
jgi:hypothetical protein